MTTRIAGLTYSDFRSKVDLVKCRTYLLCLFGLFISRVLVAQSDGGVTSGAASFCDSLNSGFISLNFFNGNVLYWEQSTDNQNSWQQIQNTTSTQSYNQLKQTTSYRAIVQDGSFPPDTSTVATITVHVPGVAGFITGADTVCSGANSGSLVLTATQGTVVLWQSRVGANAWQPVNDSDYVHVYSNILASTFYRAVVRRVPGCVADTSAFTQVIVDETTLKGVLLGGDSLCFGSPADTLILSGARGTFFNWIASPDGTAGWDSVQTGGSFYVYPRVTDTTWYAVVVKNGVCSADTTEPAILLAYPQVIAEAGPAQTITRKESVQLGGESSAGAIVWRPGAFLSDSTSASPTATPALSTTYKILVTDIYGCQAIDSVHITVEIPIPSAITPNGDGVNDKFEIYEVERFPMNRLHIYDRWGNLVFEANAYHNEWDGRGKDGSALPESTYYYTFDYGVGSSPVSGYILIKR